MRLMIMPGFFLILIALAIIGGCGSVGDQTLAVVNDYEITVEEFENMMGAPRTGFPSAQVEFEARTTALDSMVVVRMLVQAAYEMGIDQSEELARVVLANKDKFLLDILYKKEIADKCVPTEAEMRDFYDHLDIRMHVSQIIVTDGDTATALFERLKAGESFEKLAYEYSVVPSAQKDKGDLGWVTWGALVDEVQQVAYQMEDDEIAPPIESFLGFHLIKMIERRPNEPGGTFEQMQADLDQRLRGLKSYRRTREFFEELQQKYTITIDSATCDYLMHKRESMYPPQLLATLPKSDFDLESLDRNEKELVLALWDGGHMTVLQYLTQAGQFPPNLRPDLDDYDSLSVVIFAMKRNEIMVNEARLRGLESDSEYQRKLRLFKELNMAELMKTDSIPQPPEPDEGMIRQYYEDNPAEFTNPAKVHLYEILLSDESKATQLTKQLRSKQAFKEKALELTQRPGRRAVSGDMDYIVRSAYPSIFDAAWETPVGSVGGPVLDRGKYSIFWVEDKMEAELKAFEGIKRDAYQKLVYQGEKVAFETWVAQRREVTSVEVNEDAIWSLIDTDAYAADSSSN